MIENEPTKSMDEIIEAAYIQVVDEFAELSPGRSQCHE